MNKVKTGGSIILVPIEDIMPPNYSSRKVVSLEELYKLADSIKSSGILSPVIVRTVENGTYQIVSGERRRRAALIAGCKNLPCVLMNTDDYEAVIYNVSENLHRKELHFLETAQVIDELHECLSIEELTERLSIPEGMILSRIKLLSLPENIKWKIMTGNLSESTANALCKVTDAVRQNEITDLIISTGCSFNEAYEMTEKLTKKAVFAAHYRDYRIFENTIEHAVDTMKASGIDAECRKITNDSKIIYTVTINKMV